MSKKILVVEDEKNIAELERDYLEANGYTVEIEFDGKSGLDKALGSDYDLVILDVMLPGLDGFEVCRQIRKHKECPVLMVSAKKDEIDKIRGLGLGADDYITKPFSIKELIARVQANLRRGTKEFTYMDSDENDKCIKQGELTLNLERLEVKKNGKLIELTLREFELLKFLAMQPEKIYSREALMEKVWGYDYLGDLRTVDVTVRRLREKIEDNPSEPKYVITKRSMGYYFARQ